MDEQEARIKLQEMLIARKTKDFTFRDVLDGVGFVDEHIAKIKVACGGQWDNQKAMNYVLTLEARLEQGLEQEQEQVN